MSREALKNLKRVVVKVGTSTLTYENGKLNLRRIELLVLKDNIRAQRLYKKVGFQLEGEKREAVYKDGEYKNMYMMSLLKSEYIGIEM